MFSGNKTGHLKASLLIRETVKGIYFSLFSHFIDQTTYHFTETTPGEPIMKTIFNNILTYIIPYCTISWANKCACLQRAHSYTEAVMWHQQTRAAVLKELANPWTSTWGKIFSKTCPSYWITCMCTQLQYFALYTLFSHCTSPLTAGDHVLVW